MHIVRLLLYFYPHYTHQTDLMSETSYFEPIASKLFNEWNVLEHLYRQKISKETKNESLKEKKKTFWILKTKTCKENKMGYYAKVRIYSHIYCVIVAIFISNNHVNDVHGASSGGSWPPMKTFDIWGSPQNKAGPQAQRNAASNNLELQDYRDKTSFRNEKGNGLMIHDKTVLILYASIRFKNWKKKKKRKKNC